MPGCTHPDFRKVKVERVARGQIAAARQVDRAHVREVTPPLAKLKVISEREAVIVQRDCIVGQKPAGKVVRRAVGSAIKPRDGTTQIVASIREAARRRKSAAFGIDVNDNGIVIGCRCRA